MLSNTDDCEILKDIQWLTIKKRKTVNNFGQQHQIMKDDKICATVYTIKKYDYEMVCIYIGGKIIEQLGFKENDCIFPMLNLERSLLLLKKNIDNNLGYKLVPYPSQPNIFKLCINLSRMGAAKKYYPSNMAELRFRLEQNNLLLISLKPFLNVPVIEKGDAQ